MTERVVRPTANPAKSGTLGQISANITESHPISPDLTKSHQISPSLTKSHQISGLDRCINSGAHPTRKSAWFWRMCHNSGECVTILTNVSQFWHECAPILAGLGDCVTILAADCRSAECDISAFCRRRRTAGRPTDLQFWHHLGAGREP